MSSSAKADDPVATRRNATIHQTAYFLSIAGCRAHRRSEATPSFGRLCAGHDGPACMNIVGVDIGGTFTDLVGCVDGRIVTSKTSTVPADPTRGVAESLKLAHCEMPALSELLHGSTIAINTVLERKGARTALITTRGFRDTYAIGRGNRVEAFNLFFHRPKPLIPRELTFEVTERINANGVVLKPLDEAEVQALAKSLAAQNIEAIAVCFLH